MTRISGHTLITSPCCKSPYKVVEYASMNFSAYAYWTDGAKDGGLMPNDGGLRVCRCGTAFLLRDAIRLEIEASPDTLFPPKHHKVLAMGAYWGSVPCWLRRSKIGYNKG